MYPKVNPKSGVTTEWTIHRKALLEVWEKHNTADGIFDAAACIGCNYYDYWEHITYLLPWKAPLPFSWKVLSENSLEKDQEPEMKEPQGEIGKTQNILNSWNIMPRSSSEMGENPGDTLTTLSTGRLYYFGNKDSAVGWEKWNKPDTIQVIRMVSDTRPSLWWRSVNHAPWPQVVWMIADHRSNIRYLNWKKKPFPQYMKIWPLQ
jgi:hypothetical protein